MIEKNCLNCKHIKFPSDERICDICISDGHGGEKHTEWEPMLGENKTNKQNITAEEAIISLRSMREGVPEVVDKVKESLKGNRFVDIVVECYQNRGRALDLAINVLCDQNNKLPCSWCNEDGFDADVGEPEDSAGITINKEGIYLYINPAGYSPSSSIKIKTKFCPNCGRKL